MKALQPNNPLLKIKIRSIIDMIREILKNKYISKDILFKKIITRIYIKKKKICMAEGCECINPMTFIF